MRQRALSPSASTKLLPHAPPPSSVGALGAVGDVEPPNATGQFAGCEPHGTLLWANLIHVETMTLISIARVRQLNSAFRRATPFLVPNRDTRDYQVVAFDAHVKFAPTMHR